MSASTYLQAPKMLRARTLSSSSIQCTWNPSPTEGATYEVFAWVIGSDGSTTPSLTSATVPAGSQMYTFVNLIPNTPYKFQVVAKLGNRTSRSNTVQPVLTQHAAGTRGAPKAPTSGGSGTPGMHTF